MLFDINLINCIIIININYITKFIIFRCVKQSFGRPH